MNSINMHSPKKRTKSKANVHLLHSCPSQTRGPAELVKVLRPKMKRGSALQAIFTIGFFTFFMVLHIWDG